MKERKRVESSDRGGRRPVQSKNNSDNEQLTGEIQSEDVMPSYVILCSEARRILTGLNFCKTQPGFSIRKPCILA